MKPSVAFVALAVVALLAFVFGLTGSNAVAQQSPCNPAVQTCS